MARQPKDGIYMLAENIGTQVRENTGISIDLSEADLL